MKQNIMEPIVVCSICGGKEWVSHEKYPFIRRCANANCNGLHPHDISKLKDIEGQIFDDETNEMTDFDELEKRVK